MLMLDDGNVDNDEMIMMMLMMIIIIMMMTKGMKLLRTSDSMEEQGNNENDKKAQKYFGRVFNSCGHSNDNMFLDIHSNLNSQTTFCMASNVAWYIADEPRYFNDFSDAFLRMDFK